MEHNPVTQAETKQTKLALQFCSIQRIPQALIWASLPQVARVIPFSHPHPLAPALLFFHCMFIPHPGNIFPGPLYSQEYFLSKENILNIYQCKGLELTSDKPGFGLPRWLSIKESACQTGDTGLIPELGRSSGEGNGNTLQYLCFFFFFNLFFIEG